MLNNYQIIKEDGKPKYAVVDYLHIQKVKSSDKERFSIDDVKRELGI